MASTYETFIKNLEKEKNIHIKVKGSSVGKPNCFNRNLMIIKMSIVNYFLTGKSIYDTINENQQLINYQIIKKRSSQTRYLDVTNNIALPDKVLRMFPVTKGGIKVLTDTMKEIPDVPAQVIIYKENVQNLTVKDIPNLDINYYVQRFNDDIDKWMNGTGEDIDNITLTNEMMNNLSLSDND